MIICQYCNQIKKSEKSLIAHKIYCKNNPNRKIKKPSHGMKGKTAWNKGLTKENNDIIKKQAENQSYKIKNGKMPLSGVALWTTEQHRDHAISMGLGGYREGAGRSKKFYVEDSFGNIVCLQSSYELKCAEILSNMDIHWIRPTCIRYDNKRYFPDFYLPDYDLYLDPKNIYLAKKDEEKINKVVEQNNVKVYILTEDMINEFTIKHILSHHTH